MASETAPGGGQRGLSSSRGRLSIPTSSPSGTSLANSPSSSSSSPSASSLSASPSMPVGPSYSSDALPPPSSPFTSSSTPTSSSFNLNLNLGTTSSFATRGQRAPTASSTPVSSSSAFLNPSSSAAASPSPLNVAVGGKEALALLLRPLLAPYSTSPSSSPSFSTDTLNGARSSAGAGSMSFESLSEAKANPTRHLLAIISAPPGMMQPLAGRALPNRRLHLGVMPPSSASSNGDVPHSPALSSRSSLRLSAGIAQLTNSAEDEVEPAKILAGTLASNVYAFEWLGPFGEGEKAMSLLLVVDDKSSLWIYQFAHNQLPNLQQVTSVQSEMRDTLTDDTKKARVLIQASAWQRPNSTAFSVPCVEIKLNLIKGLANSRRTTAPAVEANSIDFMLAGKSNEIALAMQHTILFFSFTKKSEVLEMQLVRRFNFVSMVSRSEGNDSTRIYADMVCVGDWVFGLKPSGNVDLWDSFGAKRALIDIPTFYKASHPSTVEAGASPEIQHVQDHDTVVDFVKLAVSREMDYLCIGERGGVIYGLKLDPYFQHFPLGAFTPSTTLVEYSGTGAMSRTSSVSNLLSAGPGSRSSIAVDTGGSTKGNKSTSSNLQRWFDTKSMELPFAYAGAAANYSLFGNPVANKSKAHELNGFSVRNEASSIYQTASSRAGSVDNFSPSLGGSISDLSRLLSVSGPVDVASSPRSHGADTQQEELAQAFQDIVCMLVPRRSCQLLALGVAPTSLICLSFVSYPSPQRWISLYCRDTSDELSMPTEAKSGLPLLNLDNACAWYQLQADGFYALLPRQVQDTVLHNLIMFENASMADKLCLLNNWDRHTLQIHALRLGIKYRQISVVKSAIRNLTPEQQILGSKMIAEYALSNTSTTDQDFIHSLLQLGINYVSDIIKTKAANLQTTGRDPHAFNTLLPPGEIQELETPMAELLEFSNILHCLRQCHLASGHLKRISSHSSQDGAPIRSPSISGRKRVARPRRSLFPPGSENVSRDGMEIEISRRDSNVSALRLDMREKRQVSIPRLLPQLTFGSVQERWRRMEDSEIIRDALLTGKVSLVLAYLQARFDANPSETVPPSPIAQFQYLKKVTFALVYQAVCQDQVDLAAKMLVNMGEQVAPHFSEIAWYTTRRSVRNRLLALLNDRPLLPHVVTSDYKEVIAYTRLLERLYPNSYYSLEFIRRGSAHQPTLEAISFAPPNFKMNKADDIQFVTDDIDDLLPATAAAYGFKLLGSLADATAAPLRKSTSSGSLVEWSSGNYFQPGQCQIVIPPITDGADESEGIQGSGYLQLSLQWVSEWDEETKIRILLEKDALSPERQLECMPIVLRYLASHAQLPKLLQTINTLLPKAVDLVPSSLPTIVKSISSALTLAPPFIKELVLNDLAKRGLYTAEEKADPKLLLRRMCKASQLFSAARPRTSAEESTDLDTPTLTKSDWTSVEKYIMQLCVDLNLPLFLQAYTDHHQLADTPAGVEELLSHVHDPPAWLRLFFDMRLHSDIVACSLSNASLLAKREISTMQELLDNQGGLVTVGTLLFAPQPLEQILRGSDRIDPKWRVDAGQLRRSLKEHPTLQQALFPPSEDASTSTPTVGEIEGDIVSGKGDVTLFQLLAESVTFDIPQVFRLSEPAGTLRRASSEPLPRTLPSFRDPVLVESIGYRETLDVHYYLAKERPFQAFQSLLENSKDALFSPTIDALLAPATIPTSFATFSQRAKVGSGETLGLSQSEQEHLQRYALAVALWHLEDTPVTAACSVFLQLCGLTSDRLRIDAESARRIFVHSSTRPPEQMPRKERVALFLSFPDTCEKVFSMLENASKPLCSFPDAPARSPEEMVIKPEPFETNPWSLVNEFCRTHGLPHSTWHLRELAKRNAWLAFLQEAQLQGIQASQVMEVIKEFPDPNLRGHLHLIIRNFIDSQQSTSKLPAPRLLTEDDLFAEKDPERLIFDLVLYVQKYHVGAEGQQLLVWCLEHKRPTLAVVAACFDDSSSLKCLLAWLIASAPTQLRDSLAEAAGPISDWNLECLGELIVLLCNEKQFLLLQRAFLLFDSSNVLLKYLLFHQAFTQYRFLDAAGHLNMFAFNIASTSPSGSLIGDYQWQKRLAIRLMNTLLDQAPSGYEQGQLLALAERAGLWEEYSRLYRVFVVLRAADLPLRLLKASSEEILEELMKKEDWKHAREYVTQSGDTDQLDSVTQRQLTALLEHHRSSGGWSIEQERMNLWKRCKAIGDENNCCGKVAGMFFYERAEEARAASRSPKEQLFLYNTALSCFTAGTGKPSQSPEFLKELEDRILLLSIASQANLIRSEGREDLAASSSEVDAAALQQVIGKLINSGDLAKAESICKQLKTESKDLIVVKTMTALAEGTPMSTALTSNVVSLMTAKKPTGDVQALIESGRKKVVLEWLLECCVHSREYAEKLVVQYKIAQQLTIPFSSIPNRDPYNVLLYLLLQGKPLFPLVDAFIVHYKLSYSKVAVHLAETFWKAVQGQTEQKRPEDKVGIDPTWSDDDFAQFVNLSKAPQEVGNRLVYLISKHRDISHAAEVELLVRAHHCFGLSCSIKGSEMVLHLVRERVEDYAANREFKLLVRLLTGIKTYHELRYVFDLILQYDQFEVMLRKDVQPTSKLEAMEYRLAVQRYLQATHPKDTEKLMMMFLAFNMHREMGEFLQTQAYETLNGLKGVPLTPNIIPTLNKIMGQFLDAADNFVKDRSFTTSSHCLSMAGLIALQLKVPEARLINLTSVDAGKLMSSRANFAEAFTIARAYELNHLAEWTMPVYQQCVVGGNYSFLQELLQNISFDPTLYSEIVKKFKSDPQRNSHTASMKKFLAMIDDRFLRYDLAKEAGLNDVAQQLLTAMPELAYWKVDQREGSTSSSGPPASPSLRPGTST